MKKYIKSTMLMLLIFFMGCSFVGCKKEKEVPDTTNPYRENIIGRWKLVEVSTIVNYDYQIIDTVDYSDSNIIYNFRADNTLIVVGSISGDLSEGKHSYQYTRPIIDPLADPGPNLLIDSNEFVYCSALKKENTMETNGKKIIRAGETLGRRKAFIKVD